MRKFVCLLGMLLSLSLIALGVYNQMEGFTYLDSDLELQHANYSGNTASSTSFGADFYTYSYRATRYAANNVHSLGSYVEDVVGMASGVGLVVVGLAGLLVSIYGFCQAGASSKQHKQLARIADSCEKRAGKQQELFQQLLGNQKANAEKQQSLLTQLLEANKANGQKQQEILMQLVNEMNTSAEEQVLLLQRIADQDVSAKPAARAEKAAEARTQPESSSVPASRSAVTAANTWICSLCGHENPANQAACAMCATARKTERMELHKGRKDVAADAVPKPLSNIWVCQTCGTQNVEDATECAVCGENR